MERFTGSTRPIEGGFPVTHYQDFKAHVTGGDWKHFANQIQVSPSVAGGSEVQTSLSNLAAQLGASGTGFISIGQEGTNSIGDYNMGSVSYPTWSSVWTAALTDPRISAGGTIFLMTGTYNYDSTISLPDGYGYCILGESPSTIINSRSSNLPAFKVGTSSGPNLNGDSGSGDTTGLIGSNYQQIQFTNLIFTDNYDGYVSSGGASLTSLPFIQIKRGGSLLCRNVSFIGRLNDGSITNRVKTFACVASTSGNATGTSIVLESCYVDGVKKVINNSTQLGKLDNITITNCKIRWFGKEGASYDSSNDSLIYTSNCNLQLTNNYVVGAGTFTETLVTLDTASNVDSDLSSAITGNSGYLTASNKAYLVNNLDSGGPAFRLLTEGNNFENQIGSWSLVVGGGGGYTASPAGDINGITALDTVINTYGSQNQLDATIIIQPGTYILTLNSSASLNFSKLKFIGNKLGYSYPEIRLEISSSDTTNLGNRYFVLGNHLESIYFFSNNTMQSVVVSFDPTTNNTQNVGQTCLVKDCVFVDTSLELMDLGAGPIQDQEGNPTQAQLLVEDCYFYQSTNFDPNVSFNSSLPHQIVIRNSFFVGTGYWIHIDQVGGDVTPAFNKVTLENVVTSNNAGALNTPNVFGSSVIDITCSDLIIRNCKLIASEDLENISIYGGTADDNPISFIKLTVDNLVMDSCTINGPDDTFTTSSVDYVLPAVQVFPAQGVRITNCNFISGGLPLQITGTLTDATAQNAIYLAGNNFSSSNAADPSISQCMLDIDVLHSSSYQTCYIANNTFASNNTGGYSPVYHTEITGSSYLGTGIVQLFCKGINVVFQGNQISGSLTTVSGVDHYAGLIVNNYDGSGNSNLGPRIKITDNNILITNGDINTADSTQSASCCYFRGVTLGIHQNNMLYVNGTPDSSFAGCMVIDGRGSGTGIVSDNFFNRTDPTASATSLSRGYIQITSGTTFRGGIVNNAFDSTTFNGSSTDLIEDNTSSTLNWWSNQNRNQVKTLVLRGNQGIYGYRDAVVGTDENIVLNLGNPAAAYASYIKLKQFNGSGDNIEFIYEDTSQILTFRWQVDLSGLIPYGAYVTDVSVVVDLSANAGGGGAVSTTRLAVIASGAVVASDSNSSLTTTGDTLALSSLSPNAAASLGVNSLGLELRWSFLSNATSIFNAGPVTITYRY